MQVSKPQKGTLRNLSSQARYTAKCLNRTLLFTIHQGLWSVVRGFCMRDLVNGLVACVGNGHVSNPDPELHI
jgi:hypothetical protein